jgi:hypothetical protein
MTDYSNLNEKDLYLKFEEACKNEDIHILDYIFNTPHLNRTHEHFCIQGVYNACHNDSPKVLDYLLNLVDSEPVYRTINDGSALHIASGEAKFKIMDYLFKTPHLKEYKEKYADLEHAFNQAARFKQIKMMEYIITELNIPRTESFNLDLNQLPGELKDYFEKLLEMRDLNTSLNSELNTKEAKAKKTKL